MWKLSKWIFIILVIILTCISGSDWKCPHISQWYFTSKSYGCSDQNNYICLFDALKSNGSKAVFTEKCGHLDLSREGFRYIFTHDLNQVPCTGSRYQPFTFTTNGNSQCVFSKSLCKSSGQVLAKNLNSSTDASCRCDYRQNYDYVIPPKDPCSCRPAEEDCSCYIRKCDDDKVMIADYRCLKNVETILPEDIKCPVIISRIKPPEETDTVYNKQLQPVTGSSTWSKQVSVFLIVIVVIYTVLIGFLFFSVPHVTSILLKSESLKTVFENQLSLKRKENEFMILNGGKVKIECNVKSYIPVRSVIWQKEIDGEIIQITPSEEKYKMDFGKMPSLTIDNFNAGDPGKYRCIVRNSVGLRNEIFGSCLNLMSSVGWLTGFVSALQHIPAFHTEDITLHSYHGYDIDSQSKPTVYNVYKGDDITLEQHSNDEQKLVAVKWFKESDKWTELDLNNEQYSGGVTGVPSLTIKINRIENAGKYFCLLIYDNGETQTSLFKLKLIPQVEIYKALLEHREDKTYIRPAICDSIVKQLQENNIVVITGREGTGKSKTCLELASIYDKHDKDYVILKVDLSKSYKMYTDIVNALLIIDDTMYTHNSLNDFVKYLSQVLLKRNIKVILTCRNLDLEIVRSVPEINKLTNQTFIDINCCLTDTEKEKMLKKYMEVNDIAISASKESNFKDPKILTDFSVQVTLDEGAIKAIKNEEPWKGFPVCASLFCSEREFLHLGEKYFTSPPSDLFQELKELYETAKNSNSIDTFNEYCILVYILVDTKQELDLNAPNLCRRFVQLYHTLFQFKYIPEKPGSNEDQKIAIEKAAHKMNNKYLKLHNGVYKFIHPCMLIAMFLSSDYTVFYLLQNGSLSDITEFVRSKECTVSTKNEIIVKVDQSYHHILCERLVRHAFEDHKLLLKVADYIYTYWRSSGNDLQSSGNNLHSSSNDLQSSVNDLRSSGNDLQSSGNDLRSSGNDHRSSGINLVDVMFRHIEFILFQSLGVCIDNFKPLDNEDISEKSTKAEKQVSLSNITMLVGELTHKGRDPWIYETGTADFLILSGLVTAAMGRYATNRDQTFNVLLTEFQNRKHSETFVKLLSTPLDINGNTFFHFLMGLSQKEASEIISVTAERKFIYNTENVKKYTPLDIAAFLGKIDIFKVLNLKTSNCTNKLRKRLKKLAKSGKAAYYKENSKNINIDQPMIHKTMDDSASPCSPEKLEFEDADINDKKEVIDENKKDKSFLKRKFSIRNEEHKKEEQHDRKDVLSFEDSMINIVVNGKIEDYQSIIKLFSK